MGVAWSLKSNLVVASRRDARLGPEERGLEGGAAALALGWRPVRATQLIAALLRSQRR